MAKSKAQLAQEDADRQESLAYLRKLLKRGDTVYTTVRHVSSSGMSREISSYIAPVTDGKAEIICIDYSVQTILGWKEGRHGGTRVGGCGMDMGFHLVYRLSSAMFDEPVTYTQSKHFPDPTGGYALKHEWL